MYLGKIVEIADAQTLFEQPRHPTRRRCSRRCPCRTRTSPTRARRILLRGDVPSPIDPPSGCRFHPRCPQGARRVRAPASPRSRRAAATRRTHRTACHFPVDRGRRARARGALRAAAGARVSALPPELDRDADRPTPTRRAIEGRSPWQLAWARLRRDRVAIVCLAVIVLIALIALAAPLLRLPDGPRAERAVPDHGPDARGPAAGRRAARSGSARTSSAATCSCGWSTARGSRCSPASSRAPRPSRRRPRRARRRLLRRPRRHAAGAPHGRRAVVPVPALRDRARLDRRTGAVDLDRGDRVLLVGLGRAGGARPDAVAAGARVSSRPRARSARATCASCSSTSCRT